MSQSNNIEMSASTRHHQFPWWLAFLLTSPVRRLLENPDETLGALVKPGQVVLELGPGSGFFSVPIARALGPSGKLIAVDNQPPMLRLLRQRLERYGVAQNLTTRLSKQVENELGDLEQTVDLVVAINVVHELPKPRDTLAALARTLRSEGRLLFVEPRGHVSRTRFALELDWARQAGLERDTQGAPLHPGRLHALLKKTAPSEDGRN